MPFIPVPNTAQVELVYLSQGQRCENVFHVQGIAPFTQEDLEDLANTFKVWYTTQLDSDLPATVSLELVVAKALDTDTSPAVEFNTGLPATGAMTDWHQLPNNVTVAVRWLTGLRGRSYRGRTYHIALSEEQVSGNTVDTVFANAIRGRYEQLLSTIQADGLELVVVSRFSNNAPRVTGIATPITGVTLDTTIDSQRRRLPGRGA